LKKAGEDKDSIVGHLICSLDLVGFMVQYPLAVVARFLLMRTETRAGRKIEACAALAMAWERAATKAPIEHCLIVFINLLPLFADSRGLKELGKCFILPQFVELGDQICTLF
jgi:hypothetical protein